MSAFRRWKQALLAALLLALTVAAWVLFAPQQVGGSAAYVIILGNSMEPVFRRGDLVIVRRAPLYQVGEAVAYTDPQLQRYIFHRIIEREGDRFLLKGDHNDWVDSYQPRADEILGKQWIHLPGFGRAVQWLRKPPALGAFAGLIGGVLAAGFLGRSSRRRSGTPPAKGVVMPSFANLFSTLRERGKRLVRFRRVPRHAQTDASPVRRGLGTLLEALFFVFGLLAFLSLTLGIFAFTRPLQRLAPDDVEYQHSGAFAYTAAAPPGVYDAPQVTPGQPVFPRLTCLVTVHFDYALLGQDVQNVSGTYRLGVKVRDERSGWERNLLIQPETPFEGRTYSAANVVNLCSAVMMVETLQEKTDYRNLYYSFAITPVVTVHGTVAGRPLQDTFAPSLTFNFDSLLFYLRREEPESNPLLVSQHGVLAGWKSEANTIAILGKAYPVRTLRRLSAGGLFLSLLMLGALTGFVFSLARRSQAELNRVKYDSLLVEMEPNSQPPSAPLVEVATIDDLARLAERHGTAILYQPRRPLHYYFVQGGGILYRYAVSEAGGVLTASLAQLEGDLRRALERQEFRVYYQPIVSLPERRIVGVEALLRWQHPQHGLVSPGEFLAAAEATGLIQPIGEWLLQAAGAQCQAWKEAGVELWLAINLSLRELLPARLRLLRRLIETCHLPPERLHIELPEAGVVEQEKDILPYLQELNESGVHIALDDFTGRASIQTLERLPLRSVKLDRPLVAGSRDPQEAALLQRSIRAAQGWGLEVAAEGVENEQELAFLLSSRCALGQGYLFARPLPAEQLTPLLVSGTLSAAPTDQGQGRGQGKGRRRA